jgi:glycosyltransferase involved in cell wall biosynthesis
MGEIFVASSGSPGTRRNAVLFFGRIVPYKGIDLFLEASLILGDRFKYIIAGPGRFSKVERQFLERAPTGRYEVINRYIPDREVAALFARTRVCVLPYRDATQSSVPGISAYFGVPVVATAVGCFVEDVPRVNGVLVNPGDFHALAEGIVTASNKQVRYPEELEFVRLAPEFIKAYEEAIERTRK